MSVLTKNERDGLDDVFLSIHSHADKFQKMKELSSFVIHYNPPIFFFKLLKQAKNGLKKVKVSRFLGKMSKKKKNLSK
jgi:hypothetical protein